MRTPLIADLTRQVINALSQAGWSFSLVKEHVLEAGFEGHHSRYQVHVQTFPEIGAVSAVAEGSQSFPVNKRPALAELILRTNQQLTVGNFELLWDQGLPLFRATNLFPAHGPFDPAILTSLVHTSVTEMDRLAPYLTVLAQTPAERLHALSVKGLLQREDLLPDWVKVEDPETRSS
ncbi:MAG: YbjN domain-containing protein [Verrucomicrobiota bacterium]